MEDGVTDQMANPALRRIRAHLQCLKAPIDRQIREYPTPIAGCDAQFNHLLEERRRLAQDLNRLDAIEQQSASEQRRAVDAFLAGLDDANRELLTEQKDTSA